MKRRGRPQSHQQSSGRTGNMAFVICPNCGDPVAGALPPKIGNMLTCAHCKANFEFKEDEKRRGLLTFDTGTNRWKVVLG